MFDCSLGLMTGIDLPIPELQLVIHQPTIREISMIGEPDFFIGVQMLSIDKNSLTEEEALQEVNNFQIFMTILNENQLADKKVCVEQVLTLLFPGSKIIFTPRAMIIKQSELEVIIDEGNFEFLQSAIIAQFCLKGSGQETFNPKNDKAKEIARKIMRGRQKAAQLKAAENSGSAFAQYLSALTVGIGSMSLQDCTNLTMYQLYDLIERYSLYINWDIELRARLAGAKGDKPLDNWMKQIHN